jgi:hypothetical protein
MGRGIISFEKGKSG